MVGLYRLLLSAPYSLTRNSIWAVGHWALADDLPILHRLAGSDGLELVPENANWQEN